MPDAGRSAIGEFIRDGITSIISLAIVATSIYLLLDVYGVARVQISPADNKVALDAYARQKDILQLALGFLGTVTGYYLGRAPAEKAASTARAAQTQAEKKETETRKVVDAGLADIVDSGLKGGAAPADVNAIVARIRQQLSQI